MVTGNSQQYLLLINNECMLTCNIKLWTHVQPNCKINEFKAQTVFIHEGKKGPIIHFQSLCEPHWQITKSVKWFKRHLLTVALFRSLQVFIIRKKNFLENSGFNIKTHNWNTIQMWEAKVRTCHFQSVYFQDIQVPKNNSFLRNSNRYFFFLSHQVWFIWPSFISFHFIFFFKFYLYYWQVIHYRLYCVWLCM